MLPCTWRCCFSHVHIFRVFFSVLWLLLLRGTVSCSIKGEVKGNNSPLTGGRGKIRLDFQPLSLRRTVWFWLLIPLVPGSSHEASRCPIPVLHLDDVTTPLEF